MSELEIICIDKDNVYHQDLHEAIAYYGWKDASGKTGRWDRQTMVKWIEEGNKAYVEDVGKKVYCYVRSSVNGTKFLQTQADGEWKNNLLSLPECSK
jgi:hypothetical protein